MIWFWLRILDVLKPFFKWQGVDYEQLRSIVGIKLVMDNRRPFSLRQHQQKETSSAFIYSLLFGGILGLFMALLIANVPSVIISFTVYHSFIIVMITMMLIGDFSSVLLDTSDNTIILPRPVSSKTFYAARTTHILAYIGQMGFSLTVIPVVVTFFTYGPEVGITTIISSVLCIVLAVALTNGLYLLIMRFTSEERLKSIINYFQIFMTLLVMGGYQFLPRLLSIKNILEDVPNFKWWALLVPPMWFAGLIKLVNDFAFEWIDVSLAVLAVCAPVIIWKLITKHLTPYFTNKLSDLGTGSTGTLVNDSSASSQKRSLLDIRKWITQSGLERAAYGLVWSALKHDRKLKLRVYPALGSLFIFMIFPFLRSDVKLTSFKETIIAIGQTQSHLFTIYACIFVVISALYEINFTDEFKASWIYLSAPVKKPGVILSGALKAALAKFLLPIYSVISVLILTIWGSKAIADLVFGAIACILLIIIISVIGDKRLPLSMSPTARNQTGSFARAIISMMIIGAMGGGHYVVSIFPIVLWLACPIMLACIYFIWRLYSNLKWEEVEI